MRRRAWLGFALGLVLLAGCSRSTEEGATKAAEPRPAKQELRLVSLAPAITETLELWGAKGELVGVSDYCRAKDSLPRVGSAITPGYEAIARLRPTHILATQVSGTQLEPLERLAPTRSFPWLSPEEVIASTRELGRLVQQTDKAEELARRYERALLAELPADAPQVLLLLGSDGASGGAYWFVKDESLHGALLRAAGAKNAVKTPTPGAPRITAEELLRLDPDALVVLSIAPNPDADASLRRELEKLTPLRAARERRLGFLSGERLLDSGPRILDFVEPLRAKIRELTQAPPP